MNLIICGYDYQTTLGMMKQIADKALACKEKMYTEFVHKGIFSWDHVTAYVRVGPDVTNSFLRKGSADVIFSCSPAEVVRNLEWLRSGGRIELTTEKPGIPSDEEYPVSEMISYIDKTIL